MNIGKKGVSPVIATVLLIAIVVVLAVIVFLWIRGFIGEVGQKSVHGSILSADQACVEVDLDVLYTAGKLEITNKGNVPVFNTEIIKVSGGTETRQTDTQKILIGSSVEIDIGTYDEIKVYPAILVEGDQNKVVYTCKNEFIAKLP